jgi:hypothetical protein
MNPYITIGTILFRLGLFSGIGGLFSGLWAKYIHGIKYSIARENIKNENEYNKKTTESDEDIKRKGRNQYSNTGNTQNYSNKSFFDLEDECRLLGLNHRNVITLGDLKHAQIEKLRQWHPDVTKENKNLATEMCARINEAHEKISNRIKS